VCLFLRSAYIINLKISSLMLSVSNVHTISVLGSMEKKRKEHDARLDNNCAKFFSWLTQNKMNAHRTSDFVYCAPFMLRASLLSGTYWKLNKIGRELPRIILTLLTNTIYWLCCWVIILRSPRTKMLDPSSCFWKGAEKQQYGKLIEIN
jgi:hypothetical protein